MALEQYWQIIKKWWWLMVASTLVAALSSYVSVSRQPRIYQAVTTVMIGQGLRKSNPTYQDFAISDLLAQTYINMVQRRSILEGAADALGLPDVPWSDNISARLVSGTQLVEISVRDTSPERARALADEIANQLILQSPTEAEGDQSRSAFVQDQLQKLEKNIQTTEEEIAAEQAKLDAANSAWEIQQLQSNIYALDEKLASYQDTYASMMQAVEQGTNYISIIERASTPVAPIAPRVSETVLMAAAIGLSLAVGGALLIEFLDDTLKTADDVTHALNLPTLGAIAHIAVSEDEENLITVRHPRSPTAEAFRALRTNIQFSSVDKPVRTLVVTSANPMEGKSVVAANLAVVMAQSGRSVVIVDADMRRPRQHDVFDLQNSRGLSNVILEPQPDLSTYSWQLTREHLSRRFFKSDGKGDIESDQATWVRDLYVVTSGPIPPNSADLLGSGRMETLIESLKGQADVIIFDTPPVLAVTDAVVLATRVDGVLLVSDARHTRRATVRRAAERLRQVGAPLLGVVLNRVSSSGDGYYAYQYYYGHDGDKPHASSRSWLNSSWLLSGLTFLGRLKRSDNGPGRTPHRLVHTGDLVLPRASDEVPVGKGERKSGQVI